MQALTEKPGCRCLGVVYLVESVLAQGLKHLLRAARSNASPSQSVSEMVPARGRHKIWEGRLNLSQGGRRF